MQENSTGQQIKFVLTLVVMMVVMWVLLFLPQRKRQKQLDALMKSLKAGDKVVTSSGLLGVVISVKDRTVAIRSGESKLEILKSAVAEVTERSGAETAETKS